MYALVLVAALDVAAAPLHTFHLATYAPPADAGTVDPATQLVKGEPVTLWSIACEPSTDATTFDNPSGLKCVPAKLLLPSTNENAATLAHLEKCYRTTVERAPDAVVKAVLRGDTDAIANAVKARSQRTLVVTAVGTPGEGGTQVELNWVAGDVAVPTFVSNGDVDVTLVSAPSSSAIARDLRRHRYTRALRDAEAAWKSARSFRARTLTAGNYAAAALLAGDAAKAKAIVDALDAHANDFAPRDDEDYDAALSSAQNNVDLARSFANAEIVLKDPC